MTFNIIFMYRPFYKTLPRSSAFFNWISVRFYETDYNKAVGAASQRWSNEKMMVYFKLMMVISFTHLTTIQTLHRLYRNALYFTDELSFLYIHSYFRFTYIRCFFFPFSLLFSSFCLLNLRQTILICGKLFQI